MKKLMNLLQIGWFRTKYALMNDDGISVVELILVLVGILTPYYGVSIKCIT